MTEKEFATLKDLFEKFNLGVFEEFSFGVTVASLFSRGEISNESFSKICDYFGAPEENRVPEYVAFVDAFQREHKLGLPKETLEFINLFMEKV